MQSMILPFLLIFALINSSIELEISAPSFPNIMHAFQTSESIVGLTITYNLVGFCLASLVYGPLSECFGRRKIMLIGNAILAIGAIACVFATSISWLLVARIIQGIGAATAAVLVSAIIADIYKTSQAEKLYGIMNAVFSVLMAIAPIIGGIINYEIGWRGNYGVVAIICLISWFLQYLFLRETNTSTEKINLRKITDDYKKLFASSMFVGAASVPSLLYGCYMAFVALSPFIYMNKFHLSVTHYTLNQMAVIASFAITSVMFGQIIGLCGKKFTLLFAACLSFVSCIMIIFATSSIAITVFMSLFCIGFALIYPLIFTYSLEIFPDIKGTASSVIMGLRYFLCSVITGLSAYFYNGILMNLGIVMSFAAIMVLLLVGMFLKNNRIA